MAAHDPAAAKRVGVPQSVAQDFNAADQNSGRLSQAMRKQKAQAEALRRRRKMPPADAPDPSALGSG